MKKSELAERVLGSIDWAVLRAATGSAEGVRQGLRELLEAKNGEAAQQAYWHIENHAFVQSELFEVCEACAAVLIASLVDPREKWVRIAVLELLFQILSGYASSSSGTPEDLVERCHRTVRHGLWVLYREAIYGERDAALDVLEKLGDLDTIHKLLDVY